MLDRNHILRPFQNGTCPNPFALTSSFTYSFKGHNQTKLIAANRSYSPWIRTGKIWFAHLEKNQPWFDSSVTFDSDLVPPTRWARCREFLASNKQKREPFVQKHDLSQDKRETRACLGLQRNSSCWRPSFPSTSRSPSQPDSRAVRTSVRPPRPTAQADGPKCTPTRRDRLPGLGCHDGLG